MLLGDENSSKGSGPIDTVKHFGLKSQRERSVAAARVRKVDGEYNRPPPVERIVKPKSLTLTNLEVQRRLAIVSESFWNLKKQASEKHNGIKHGAAASQ